MYYSAIKQFDVANGEGVRTSLFVSGCEFHCPGCFNSETWDFNHGKEFTEETLENILKSCEPDYIAGLSILGGEPLHPKNRPTVDWIISAFRKRYPDKDIFLWTGYTLGHIPNGTPDVDILVDGQFVESLKQPNLRWRGSSNQCVWENCGSGEMILMEE